MSRSLLFLMGVAVLLGLMYAAFAGPGAVFPSLVIAALIAGAAIWTQRAGNNGWAPLVLVGLLTFSMPIHYASTGKSINALELQNWDEELMALDRALFGAFFPDGQISFWLDQNQWIGPHTFLGKLITEVIQLFYMSYYFWGYILVFLLGREFYRRRGEEEWRHLTAFLCAWLGAYYINFVCYILVPAIGPQFVFADRYSHALEGFGLRPLLHGIVSANQGTLQDCFPSGHTALSWITALFALKFYPRYGRACTVAAIFITFATLYLRYHWIADLLAAIPLIVAGLAWGSYWKIKSPFLNKQNQK